MKVNWRANTRPTIIDSTWTKILAENPARKLYRIVNEDATNTFRVAEQDVQPTGANDGNLLPAGSPGGYLQTSYDDEYNGNVWAYQTSGGSLTTLNVKEGY